MRGGRVDSLGDAAAAQRLRVALRGLLATRGHLREGKQVGRVVCMPGAQGAGSCVWDLLLCLATANDCMLSRPEVMLGRCSTLS